MTDQDAHQWSVPTPAGVVYHAEEDRWEVVLAPPTPGVNEWPEYVPVMTRSGGKVFDGFRPNPETYEQNPRALIGKFPRLMSFKEDRWTIVLVPGTVSKKFQQEGGIYPAHLKGAGTEIYYYWFVIDGQAVPIDY